MSKLHALRAVDTTLVVSVETIALRQRKRGDTLPMNASILREDLSRDRVQEIFDAVVDLGGRKRANLLRLECGDDRGLLERVQRLLDTYDQDPDFLEHGSVVLLTPPEEVAGCRVLWEIGSGGCGVVFAGYHVTLMRPVAIKFCTIVERERVLDEPRLYARIGGPGIVAVHDAGLTDEGIPFFVMDLVDGGLPITQYLAEFTPKIGRIKGLFTMVCTALARVHRQAVVHCDLTPANIIVSRDGEPFITDFGIAHSKARPTPPGAGTPEYMAPEQVTRRLDLLGPPTDIYYLGKILWDLLARSGRNLDLDQALARAPIVRARWQTRHDGTVGRLRTQIKRITVSICLALMVLCAGERGLYTFPLVGAAATYGFMAWLWVRGSDEEDYRSELHVLARLLRVDVRLAAILARCRRQCPEERYQDVKALLKDVACIHRRLSRL